MVKVKDDKEVKAMPLSNNTVIRRIDEMSEASEIQLVEKLKKENSPCKRMNQL
ncbi:unnamed protein product [Lymnaea stagnalis]|uniref:Uncharacterized protein n=1 Tax=Lymnaea stagnalis TaxID=6523 RepID=A0AAV2HZ36_LYMST